MVMAHSRNLRVENRRVAMLAVQDAVVMLEGTTAYLFHFQNHFITE